jgi:hypothetical protein
MSQAGWFDRTDGFSMASKKSDEKSTAELAKEYEELREELARRKEELRRRKGEEQDAWTQALAEGLLRQGERGRGE